MHQHWVARKVLKHYFCYVVSNKVDGDLYRFYLRNLMCYLFCPEQISVARRCGFVAYRKHALMASRTKTVLNQSFVQLHSTGEERRSDIHAIAHKRRRRSQVRYLMARGILHQAPSPVTSPGFPVRCTGYGRVCGFHYGKPRAVRQRQHASQEVRRLEQLRCIVADVSHRLVHLPGGHLLRRKGPQQV